MTRPTSIWHQLATFWLVASVMLCCCQARQGLFLLGVSVAPGGGVAAVEGGGMPSCCAAHAEAERCESEPASEDKAPESSSRCGSCCLKGWTPSGLDAAVSMVLLHQPVLHDAIEASLTASNEFDAPTASAWDDTGPPACAPRWRVLRTFRL